jgi:hypothetical protein
MPEESVQGPVTADGLFEWNGSAWKPRGPLPPNTRTPDGRFSFDGTSWTAIPLDAPMPLLNAHRRVFPRRWWFLIVPVVAVGGVVATLILFRLTGSSFR